MRVVCLVPSWTETLLQCGVTVVGRTRYCIHPSDKVASIPVVGGTRQVDWAKVTKLKPDLLVLDQQENPRSIVEQSAVQWIATQVTSVWDVERELRGFHERLGQPELAVMADRWRRVCEQLASECRNPGWLELPGVMEWVRQPGRDVDRFLYFVWKDPWKAAGPDTFIGSVLGLLGYGSRMIPLIDRYPCIRPDDVDPERTLLLFSSEPYPFHSEKKIVEALPFPSAIVDGECYSWFGVRTLRFLEKCALASSQ